MNSMINLMSLLLFLILLFVLSWVISHSVFIMHCCKSYYYKHDWNTWLNNYIYFSLHYTNTLVRANPILVTWRTTTSCWELRRPQPTLDRAWFPHTSSSRRQTERSTGAKLSLCCMQSEKEWIIKIPWKLQQIYIREAAFVQKHNGNHNITHVQPIPFIVTFI